MQPNLEQIMNLAEQIATPHGLSVVDAKVSQQGKRRTLEVTIFKPGGRIGLGDCEAVSRELDELLDRQSPPLIEGAFLLEVQSPGIDRKLKTEREFRLFRGNEVEVLAKEKIGNLGATFTGELISAEGGQLIIAKPKVPKASSKKSKQAKQAKQEVEAPTPEQIELELEKVIHIKLMAPAPAKIEEMPVETI